MACFRYSTLTLILLVGGGTTVSVLGCNDFPVRPHRYEPSELVTDGGFEHPRIAAYEYDSYSAGADFDAWTIDSGAIDQLSGRVWGPADGAQSIDMDGSCGTGTIHQDLPTEAGIPYELRFALGGNPNGPPVVKRLEVSWGGSVVDTVSFDVTGGSKGDPGWVPYMYGVVASGSVTRLQFRSLSSGCYGALLDAVSVRKTPPI